MLQMFSNLHMSLKSCHGGGYTTVMRCGCYGHSLIQGSYWTGKASHDGLRIVSCCADNHESISLDLLMTSNHLSLASEHGEKQ